MLLRSVAVAAALHLSEARIKGLPHLALHRATYHPPGCLLRARKLSQTSLTLPPRCLASMTYPPPTQADKHLTVVPLGSTPIIVLRACCGRPCPPHPLPGV